MSIINFTNIKSKFEKSKLSKDVNIKNYIYELKKIKDMDINNIDNVKNIKDKYSDKEFKNIINALIFYLKINNPNDKNTLLNYEKYLVELNSVFIDYQNIKDKFKNTTLLKDISIKNYIIQLKKLKDMNINNIDNVKNIKDNYSCHVFKNIVTALVSYLKMNFEKNKDLIIKYKKYLIDLNNVINENKKLRLKSIKEDKNWTSLKSLNNIIKLIRKDLKKNKVLLQPIKQNITKKDKTLLQNYLICCLYLYHPPRRLDYANMNIVKFIDYDKTDITSNFLVIKNKSNKFFVFNQYKTFGKYGAQIIKLNKKLNNSVNFFLTYFPKRNLLLLNTENKKYNQDVLSKKITSIFYKYLNKKIGVTMIRHIYLSDKIGSIVDNQNNKLRKKLAYDMSHSEEMQDEYVKK